MQEGSHPPIEQWPDKVERIRQETDALIAASDMVKGPDGALLPRVLAGRGNAGWSVDRDALNVAKITAALLAVEMAVDLYKDMSGDGSSPYARLQAADAIVAAWLDYRDVVSVGGAE